MVSNFSQPVGQPSWLGICAQAQQEEAVLSLFCQLLWLLPNLPARSWPGGAERDLESHRLHHH